MKKIIISGVVAGLLCVNSAFAGEAITKVSPGVTPDNPLYAVDKLIENIKISLVSDADKEAELLLEIAQERLAEAQKMTDKEKIKYVNKLIDKYFDSIHKAEEKISEVILDEEKDEKIKENLSEKLESATEVNEDIKAVLDEEIKKKLDEKRDEAYLVANVVRDLDIDKVKALREEGLGYGQISQVFLLSEQSGKPVEEIAALFSQEDKGFGDIAKELDVNPLVIKFRVIEKKQAKLQEILEQAKANEDKKTVEKLEKKLKQLEEKKKKQGEKFKEKVNNQKKENIDVKDNDKKSDKEEKKSEKQQDKEEKRNNMKDEEAKEQENSEDDDKQDEENDDKENIKEDQEKDSDEAKNRIQDIIPNSFVVTRGKVRRFK